MCPSPIPVQHVMLRAPEPEDVVLLYEWENLPETRRYGDAVAPYSLQQLTDYVLSYDADIFSARQLRLMIVDSLSDLTVGCVDLFDFDAVNARAAVGIIIAPAFRRRGYGLAALRFLSHFVSDEYSLHQLYATVASDNFPSRALFAAAGFKVSGRLRSWLRRSSRFTDAYLLQLLMP